MNVVPFFYNLIIMSEDKNEELRPTKMRGVAFPKAKYGVILAIILIVLVNFILPFSNITFMVVSTVSFSG